MSSIICTCVLIEALQPLEFGFIAEELTFALVYLDFSVFRFI